MTEQKAVQRCPKGALFLEIESTSPGGRGVWFARVPVAHTLEDVLSDDYFGQTEKQIQVGDVIMIEPEHALWFVQVRVMARLPDLGKIKLREMTNMRQSYSVREPKGFKFEWRGSAVRWVVTQRDGDKWRDVQGGFDSQDEALSFVDGLTPAKQQQGQQDAA